MIAFFGIIKRIGMIKRRKIREIKYLFYPLGTV
jgi:hypothetical protein